MGAFFTSLSKNKELLRKLFEGDDMIRYRELKWGDTPAFIVYVDGMVSMDIINEFLIRPIMENRAPYRGAGALRVLIENELYNCECKLTGELEELYNGVLRGDAALFLEGERSFAIVTVKGYERRGVEEPAGETAVRGPREGFAELLNTNLSLIRRKLPTRELQFRVFFLGDRTKTRVCVCYLRDVADTKLVDTVISRVQAIRAESVLDSNYIAEQINTARFSPLKTVGVTERPDVVAANLIEGRVAVIVDGSPQIIWAPFLFVQYFQSYDDYYVSYTYAFIARCLRFLAFFVAIGIPALYLALISYHRDLIPTPLLISVMTSRQGIPFPAFIEELLLLFAFELLREAGIHTPSNISQSLSIVGGVVIGQSAVEAGIISAPMVIVIAITGITGLMLTSMKGALPVFRIALLVLSASFGLYGFTVGMIALALYIASLKSFEVPYLHGLIFSKPKALLDSLYRSRWGVMSQRVSPLPGTPGAREE